MSDLDLLVINGTKVSELVNTSVLENTPTKTSELINDSGIVTKDGTVKRSLVADATRQLSVNSGVAAGSYGATGNVTLNSNTISVSIPSISVKSNGLVTAAVNRTLQVTSY